MSGDTPLPPAIIHLLQFELPEVDAHALQQALRKIAATISIPPGKMKVATALSSHQLTCYLQGLPADDEQLDSMRRKLLDAFRPTEESGFELGRLQLVASHQGAASGGLAAYHYVVRTDVQRGGEQELEHWYDEEHMPLLAGVPGTVKACRLLCLDAPPRFYACYDLLAPEVPESDEWLKVRGTPWSDRVRPTFTNTRRVMSRLVNGIKVC
jgi:hypothetical protein